MAYINKSLTNPDNIVANRLYITNRYYVESGCFVESSGDIVSYHQSFRAKITKDGVILDKNTEGYLHEFYLSLKGLPGWYRVLNDKEIESLGDSLHNNPSYMKVPPYVTGDINKETFNKQWLEPGYEIREYTKEENDEADEEYKEQREEAKRQHMEVIKSEAEAEAKRKKHFDDLAMQGIKKILRDKMNKD